MKINDETVHAYKGIIVHCTDNKQWQILNPGVLLCSDSGKIITISESVDFKTYPNAIVHDFSNQIICPGLIDLHVHLPQYAFVGQGAEQLLEWLDKYTYPTEAKFADASFADTCISIFFNELLSYGTTLAAVYPTMHTSATHRAFGYAAHLGIRLIMGKVIMNRYAPDNLIEDYQQSHDEMIDLIEQWHNYDEGRIQYAITPRFAVSCFEDDLQKMGDLAAEHRTFIQSHLAENPDELKLVEDLYPNYDNYTQVYAENGLLTDKSLMAHCIYLDSNEINLFQESDAIQVHCPTSNRFLQSGVYPLRQRELEKINIALGSDVAGGYELSMLHEMKESIETSKTNKLYNKNDETSVLSQSEAFYYATLGAAKAIGLNDKIGNFSSGKDADFIVLDDMQINPFAEHDFFQDVEHRISRLIYRSSKDCVKAVFIRGKRLK